MSETAGIVAIPEGWILDHGSRDRLRRQLARAGSGCTAVAAEVGDLPAGASYRVWSERRALLPESDARPAPGHTVHGAAMIRPGVGFEVRDDSVTLKRAPFLVDAGAVVHDPWRRIAVLEDASPLGRPLGHRPVVLFLGFEKDPYLADWVRALVNDLVRRDVEGRIAVPQPTGGLHLTKPCAPSETSVAALAPEVVVALDDAALERSVVWLGRRPFGLVHLTPETTAEVEIDSAPNRRQRRRPDARIGRGIEGDSMVDLAHRLALTPDS